MARLPEASLLSAILDRGHVRDRGFWLVCASRQGAAETSAFSTGCDAMTQTTKHAFFALIFIPVLIAARCGGGGGGGGGGGSGGDKRQQRIDNIYSKVVIDQAMVEWRKAPKE